AAHRAVAAASTPRARIRATLLIGLIGLIGLASVLAGVVVLLLARLRRHPLAAQFPIGAPPTGARQTAVLPTAVLPTAVLPTAVLPTAVLPTAVLPGSTPRA